MPYLHPVDSVTKGVEALRMLSKDTCTAQYKFRVLALGPQFKSIEPILDTNDKSVKPRKVTKESDFPPELEYFDKPKFKESLDQKTKQETKVSSKPRAAKDSGLPELQYFDLPKVKHTLDVGDDKAKEFPTEVKKDSDVPELEFFDTSNANSILEVKAVSVGKVLAATPVVQKQKKKKKDKKKKIQQLAEQVEPKQKTEDVVMKCSVSKILESTSLSIVTGSSLTTEDVLNISSDNDVSNIGDEEIVSNVSNKENDEIMRYGESADVMSNEEEKTEWFDDYAEETLDSATEQDWSTVAKEKSKSKHREIKQCSEEHREVLPQRDSTKVVHDLMFNTGLANRRQILDPKAFFEKKQPFGENGSGFGTEVGKCRNGFAGRYRPAPMAPRFRTATHKPAVDSPYLAVAPKIDALFPYSFRYICSTCFNRNKVISYRESSTTNVCSNKRTPHAWNSSQVIAAFDEKKSVTLLRRMPENLVARQATSRHVLYVSVCRHISLRDGCWLSDQCKFAHSTVEQKCWRYCLENKRGENLESLVTDVENGNSAKESSASLPAAAIWASASVNSSQGNTALVSRKSIDRFYCHLCDKLFENERKFEMHLPTEVHKKRCLVDATRYWPFRPFCTSPPFKLCEKHLTNESCVYSNSPSNWCLNAHSIAELEEWNERIEFIKEEVKRTMNAELNTILVRISQAKARNDIVIDKVSFAEINVNPATTQRLSADDKGKPFTWLFEISTKKPLKRVFLFDKRFFHYFQLSSPVSRISDSTICYGEELTDGSVDGYYEVRVEFIGSKSLGTFNQDVMFDFGEGMKIVSATLTVHVGVHEMTLNRLSRLRKLLSFNDCWTPDNSEIIWISNERNFKPPSVVEIASNWQYDINESTFLPMMKKWITAEEMRRKTVLAEFRLKSTAKITAHLVVGEGNDRSTYKPNYDGALFADVPFDAPINEEFEILELLSGYCKNAFVAASDDKSRAKIGKRRVYEVDIVGRHTFGVESLNQFSVTLCLSAVFVRHYNLKPGDSVKIEVQFNINHKDFIPYQRALDILIEKNFSNFVFPNLLNQYLPYVDGRFAREIEARFSQMKSLELSWTSEGKNEEQCRLLRHVVQCAFNRSGYWVPPLVVFGPFGTGKTRMMAESVCALLKLSFLSHTKILICAHSNNTADMYLKLIEKYAQMSSEELKPKVWRVLSMKMRRNINTMPPFIRPYVPNERLTLEKLEQVRIVICTLSKVHSVLKLLEENPRRVAFTHIFIDEAAQALEVEVLMPLCAATRTTCVVVAGDPFQLKPTVYLNECNQLTCSYLERLYYFYEQQETAVRRLSPTAVLPKIFFKKVYRCHPDILRFVSDAIYGDKMNLESYGSEADATIRSLYFATSFGVDEIHANNVSYCNLNEITEVLEQVKYFYNNWPQAQWGAIDIGIAVPSFDQYRLIYDQLQKKGYPTSEVHVGKVIHFQGKEFKVLIISTVRGRSILNGASYIPGKLGFLDDRRLINTAMTRARHCVVVVGDPIALCSIGSCKGIWRKYIKFCFELKTFLPDLYTLDYLKNMVGDAESVLAALEQNNMHMKLN